MDPELVRVFCDEYTAELNRLRLEAGAHRASKAAELERVKRDHAKLVDAILAGVPGEQVKDRMIALDARRQALEAELATSPRQDPVRFHPGMAEVRRKVRQMVEGLSASPENRDHAKLVDAILAGVPGEQVKDRMIALDTRRRQLEAELSASPAPEPVRLHPGMADVYRRKVKELAEGLAEPARNLKVTEAIRALVDRVVLTPSAEDPRVLIVDLESMLA
jgi:hypothetical protein